MYRRTTTSAVPLLYYHPHSHFKSIHGPLHRPAPCVGRKFPNIVARVPNSSFVFSIVPAFGTNYHSDSVTPSFPIVNQVIRPSRIPSELSICWSNLLSVHHSRRRLRPLLARVTWSSIWLPLRCNEGSVPSTPVQVEGYGILRR